jgi:hypothetical protein
MDLNSSFADLHFLDRFQMLLLSCLSLTVRSYYLPPQTDCYCCPPSNPRLIGGTSWTAVRSPVATTAIAIVIQSDLSVCCSLNLIVRACGSLSNIVKINYEARCLGSASPYCFHCAYQLSGLRSFGLPSSWFGTAISLVVARSSVFPCSFLR